MAQVDSAVNAFMKDIKKAEKSLISDIEKLAFSFSTMSDTQLISATAQLNFFQELIDKGYGKSVDTFMDEYDSVLAQAVAEARKRGIDPLLGASVDALQTLKDLDTERLLGRASSYSNQLKSDLFRGIYTGQRVSSIIDRLKETELATHQMNVVAYDGIKIFDDSARYAVHKGSGVRWTYTGPQDDRTRDECENTKTFEPSKGYTESEVNQSSTPFGLRGGFNCRHSWNVK